MIKFAQNSRPRFFCELIVLRYGKESPLARNESFHMPWASVMHGFVQSPASESSEVAIHLVWYPSTTR